MRSPFSFAPGARTRDPAMNRTDRLLALVLELQRRRWTRAEDLAAAFEISKRTVYRDVRALCEAGVPVPAALRRRVAEEARRLCENNSSDC